MTVTCPYCQAEAELVDGSVIYPHRPDLKHKMFWRCAPCAAWVGCHPGSEAPLGRLANAELRRAKRRAHSVFDPLWETNGSKNKKSKARDLAYSALAKALGIPAAECHIGMFDIELCQRTVDLCVAGALFNPVKKATT